MSRLKVLYEIIVTIHFPNWSFPTKRAEQWRQQLDKINFLRLGFYPFIWLSIEDNDNYSLLRRKLIKLIISFLSPHYSVCTCNTSTRFSETFSNKLMNIIAWSMYIICLYDKYYFTFLKSRVFFDLLLEKIRLERQK